MLDNSLMEVTIEHCNLLSLLDLCRLSPWIGQYAVELVSELIGELPFLAVLCDRLEVAFIGGLRFDAYGVFGLLAFIYLVVHQRNRILFLK